MIGNLRLTCLSPGMIIRPKLGEANPLNIVTSCPCEFWFDGQDTGALALNVNKVIQWDDKSGFGRHVANAVDAQRPTYNPATGRLTFISANQTYLQSAAFGPLVQPNTFYILYKITGAIGDAEFVFDGIVGASRHSFHFQGNAFRLFAGLEILNGPTDALDNIHAAEYNGAATNYWINGVLVIGAGNVGAHTFTGIMLGRRQDGAARADVEIMEVFGYNCLLTPAERTALDAYLTSKWGL